jgi:hypothetical protein
MGEQVTFWVSDCCLMPSELFFNFIMGEQVTLWVNIAQLALNNNHSLKK